MLKKFIRFSILYLPLFLLPLQAYANTLIETLVEEKIIEEMEDSIPENGVINLRFLTPTPDDPIGINEFHFDNRNGRFQASTITEEGLLQTVVGVAIINVNIPVPVRRINSGHIIEEADLNMMDIPAFQVSANTVTDENAIVGMQVMRALAEGRPILERAIGPPIVGERGSEVTIKLHNGPIVITAPGRLLENGASGERVRVINDVSNQTIHANIIDSNTVEVKY